MVLSLPATIQSSNSRVLTCIHQNNYNPTTFPRVFHFMFHLFSLAFRNNSYLVFEISEGIRKSFKGLKSVKKIFFNEFLIVYRCLHKMFRVISLKRSVSDQRSMTEW